MTKSMNLTLIPPDFVKAKALGTHQDISMPKFGRLSLAEDPSLYTQKKACPKFYGKTAGS